MKYNVETHAAQITLQKLGFYKGAIDGLKGKMTIAALDAFERSNAKISNVAAVLLAAARTQVGIRETSKNQGPGIEKYWSATTYPDGYKNREPYCAAMVCWAVREGLAAEGGAKPAPLRSPVAYDIEKWAQANRSRVISGIDPKDARPGDLFCLATASHCGIIEGVQSGKLLTIEANTDGSGSREGDGVYQKTRFFASIRSIHRII